MDFMENDNSFFYEEIRNLINKIKESNVIDTPFPHIIIEDGFSDNITFDKLRLELPIGNPNHGVGRTEYPILLNPTNDAFLNLEKIIINKFNLNPPTEGVSGDLHTVKGTTLNLWDDTHELEIQEIHLDYLIRHRDGLTQIETNYENQTVFSIHIYLPDDDLHTDLGTSLYSVSNNFENEHDKNNFYVKPDYPLISNTLITTDDSLIEKYCNCDFTIPFKKGMVYIHPTSPDSWHSAPKIPMGYNRKSLMIRSSWTHFTKRYI